MSESPQTTLRVLLADDHPIVRSGVRAELERMQFVEVVGEASDGREALEMTQALKPDLVLMDISLPGLNGIESTHRLTQQFPGVRVIILSRHDSEEYFWHAIRAGASGYLLKKAALAELRTALERVSRGEVFLSQELAHRLRDKFPAQQKTFAKGPLDQLTERQREILQLIAEGQTTKAIALMLNVSPKTVEYHRAELMNRLGIHDIPGLVRFALRSGLIAQE